MEAARESQLTARTRAWMRGAGRALPVALALGAGLALRLWMLGKLFDVNGDMLNYGDLAKNLLLHGRFALTLPNGTIYSTLIRLPGYPLFLAVCFKMFGMGNYFAAAYVQIALDLLGCLLLAGFVRRIVPRPANRRRRWLRCGWPRCAPSPLRTRRLRLRRRPRCSCWRWPCGRWRASTTIRVG